MDALAPRKDYFEPMHTAEHILNATMTKMFGCPRSKNTHIEKKKSKCDYLLPEDPGEEKIAEIARRVNETIARNLAVTVEYQTREEAARLVDLSKLPEDAGERLRIVRIGDYDACACIGAHVKNTSEIGRLVVLSHDFDAGRLRIRFRLERV